MTGTVWIVQYDCGDYYCENEHLAGVYSSRERAERGVQDHKVKDPDLIGWHKQYNVYEQQLDETKA